jgi:general L-amino acid transport system permease protein
MTDTTTQTVSYVRDKMLPETAPPSSQVGAVRWVRENLFSSRSTSSIGSSAMLALGWSVASGTLVPCLNVAKFVMRRLDLTHP